MHIFLKALGFFSSAIDKIMLVAGFFFLIIAVAFFSQAYQLFPSASFVFGVFLLVAGTILHFESFTLKVPSIQGWGTILICVSTEFIAAAVAAAFFAVPGDTFTFRAGDKPGAKTVVLITLTRPNAWLAPILAGIGIGLLGLGVLLRFYRDIF